MAFINKSEMIHLRGTFLSTPPWISKNQFPSNELFFGPYGKLFHFLIGALNIDFSWHFPSDGQHGTLTRNGNWTGMVGMLSRNEADIILSPLVITLSRSEVVKYSPPVATLYLALMGGESSADEAANVFSYFMTFDWEVWVVIFMFWIVLVLVSLLIEYLLYPKMNWGHKVLSFSTDFFGMLFLEASNHQPPENSSRVLRCFWWLTILVLMNAFQGHFKSSMMLKPEKGRIESLDELLREVKVKPLIWKGVAYEDFFKSSPSGDIKKIMKRVSEVKGILPMDKLFSRDTIREVHLGQSVILNEIYITKSKVSSSCSPELGVLYFSKETFFPHNFAIAFRKNFPESDYQKIWRIVRRATEAGLVTKWLEIEISDAWAKCSRGVSTSAENAEHESLTMSDFSNFFAIYFLLLGIAVIGFLGERVTHSRRTRKRKVSSKKYDVDKGLSKNN